MTTACQFRWCEMTDHGEGEHWSQGVKLTVTGTGDCSCPVCRAGLEVPNTIEAGVLVHSMRRSGPLSTVYVHLFGEHKDADAYMTVAEAIEFREHLSLAISRATEASR